MGAVTVQLLRSKVTVQNGCVLCYAGGDCLWCGCARYYTALPSQAGGSASEEETASLCDRDPAGGHGGQGAVLHRHQHRLQPRHGGGEDGQAGAGLFRSVPGQGAVCAVTGCKECSAVYCSVLQCTAVYCSVLQCTAVCCGALQCTAVYCSVLQYTAVYCSVLQCTAVYCSVLRCTAVYCGVLRCTAVHCGVLQCTAVYCSALHHPVHPTTMSALHTLLTLHSNYGDSF